MNKSNFIKTIKTEGQVSNKKDDETGGSSRSLSSHTSTLD